MTTNLDDYYQELVKEAHKPPSLGERIKNKFYSIIGYCPSSQVYPYNPYNTDLVEMTIQSQANKICF